MRIPGPPLFFFCWHQLEYFLLVTFIEVCYKNTRIWIYKLFLTGKTLPPFGLFDGFLKKQNWEFQIIWPEKDPTQRHAWLHFSPPFSFLSPVFLLWPFSSHSDRLYERCHFQEYYSLDSLSGWSRYGPIGHLMICFSLFFYWFLYKRIHMHQSAYISDMTLHWECLRILILIDIRFYQKSKSLHLFKIKLWSISQLRVMWCMGCSF